MFKSSGQKAVELLIKHLELLSKKSSENQKIQITNIIADAKECNEFNEWGLAMETLLENIYDIGFKIDTTTIDLTKKAFKECQLDYSKISFIEKLVP